MTDHDMLWIYNGDILLYMYIHIYVQTDILFMEHYFLCEDVAGIVVYFVVAVYIPGDLNSVSISKQLQEKVK